MPRRDARPRLTFTLLLLTTLAGAAAGGCASTAAPSLADPAAKAPAQQAGACRTNEQCPQTEFCAKLYDSCGERGKCEERPADCTERGHVLVRPVCGCDDKTYDNACLAAAAGVSVKSEGKCTS